MEVLEERDYFTDKSVLLDPYDYFEQIRGDGPVHQMPNRDILIVTGFKEGVDVLLNTRDFSSILNPDPLAPLRFEPQGSDISGQVEAVQGTGPMDLMVSYDGDRHTAARSLLNPLFKPRGSRPTRSSCVATPIPWSASWSAAAAAK